MHFSSRRYTPHHTALPRERVKVPPTAPLIALARAPKAIPVRLRFYCFPLPPPHTSISALFQLFFLFRGQEIYIAKLDSSFFCFSLGEKKGSSNLLFLGRHRCWKRRKGKKGGGGMGQRQMLPQLSLLGQNGSGRKTTRGKIQ